MCVVIVYMANKTVDYFVSIIKGSNRLSKKEKEILVERVSGKTLDEVGKRFKVTGERIRQKEENAISKLMKKFSQLLLFDKN